MISGMDYLEEKARLAQAAALKLDQWSSDYAQADGLPNQVVRGTISKIAALQSLDFLIAKNEAIDELEIACLKDQLDYP